MIALNLTFSHGRPEFQFIVVKYTFKFINTGSSPRSSTCCRVQLVIGRGHSISTLLCCCILIRPLIYLFTEGNQYGPKPNPISQTIEAIKKSQTFAEGGRLTRGVGMMFHPTSYLFDYVYET